MLAPLQSGVRILSLEPLEPNQPVFPSYQISNRDHIRTSRWIKAKGPFSRRFVPAWPLHRYNPAPTPREQRFRPISAQPQALASTRIQRRRSRRTLGPPWIRPIDPLPGAKKGVWGRNECSFQGMSRPFHGMSRWLQGMGHPLQGMSRPLQGMGHPFLGMRRPFHGMSLRLQGIEHPLLGMGHWPLGMRHRFLGISNPLPKPCGCHAR